MIKIGKVIEVSDKPEELLDRWGQSISELTGYEYIKEDSIKIEQKSEVNSALS